MGLRFLQLRTAMVFVACCRLRLRRSGPATASSARRSMPHRAVREELSSIKARVMIREHGREPLCHQEAVTRQVANHSGYRHVVVVRHSTSLQNTKYQRSVCAGWARKSFGGSAGCAPGSAACAPDSAACHRDSAACVPESATRFGDSPGGLRAGSMVVIASNRRLPSVALFLSLCQMTYRVCRRRSVAPLCCFLT